MADETFSTDEILQVFEHLASRDESWGEVVAEHGLDPIKVGRVLKVVFPTGHGNQETATKALVLGLQFGAMRLEPFEGYEEKPCECPVCVLRRAAEAEAGGSEGGGRRCLIASA
jgi:hypothetical protein